MISQDIKTKLFQFKRIHKNQIATKKSLLPPQLENKIKRRALKHISEPKLKALINDIIQSIDTYQSHREKPHKGLSAFKETLKKDTQLS